MKAEKARAGGRVAPGRSSRYLTGNRQARGHGLTYLSRRTASVPAGEVHRRMVDILPRLRRFIWSLTNGAELSDDLVQETCLRALAHLDQWQPGSRLDSWMFRIARNLWIDQRRAERFRGEPVELDVVAHLLSYDGELLAENRIILEQLKRDIAALSAEQRNVIQFVWFHGLSYKETGRILNLPPGTVMSRMARVRGALQKFI